MQTTVCLGANTLAYPDGAGHFWVFLNWALGLKTCGCSVVWLEVVRGDVAAETVRAWADKLDERLQRYGLSDVLAIVELPLDNPRRECGPAWSLGLEAATEADLLLNLYYNLPGEVVGRFRRSALLDIDPGLLQLWMSRGEIRVPRYDIYFTTGETVGRPEARFPDAGLQWHYSPPCVSLDWWQPHGAKAGAPFTTVTQWYMNEWVVISPDDFYCNDKREGFMPFLDLPKRSRQVLELAMPPQHHDDEINTLKNHGWRIRDAYSVASTPWDYQAYVQQSAGEFSCAKPSCVRFQNAWISDRTLCYLASGKPAVVQNTGPSRALPDAQGLFRFTTSEEAVRQLETAARDYDYHCQNARALAVELFDARRVAGRLLERALP